MADLINYHRELIYEAADVQVGQRHISRDEWRLFHYKEMENTLDSVLSERSTRLSYDEVAEVKDALIPDMILERAQYGAMYNGLFERLDSIEWLGLRQTRPSP